MSAPTASDAEWLRSALRPSDRRFEQALLASVSSEGVRESSGVIVAKGGNVSEVKLSNLFMNWGKIIDLAFSNTLAVAGAESVSPWLLPLAALHLVRDAITGATEELSLDDAQVVTALWVLRRQNGIPEDEAWFEVGRYLGRAGITDLSENRFAASVTRLERLGALSIVHGRIYFRERVRIR